MNKRLIKNFCLSVILILLFVFSLTSPSKVNAEGAMLYFVPASETFVVGDTFSVEVQLDTDENLINAAKALIYFPANKLEVLNVSKENSIFTLWPGEPSFSNSSGQISFTGGLPYPGFAGTGRIITIEFKARGERVANLDFNEGQVLASDGKGTDILLFVKGAKYYIQEKIALPEPTAEVLPIFSSTHPNQEEWYNNNNPNFYWRLGAGISEVSFILDRQANTVPDTVSEGRAQSTSYETLEDGIWYFHLRGRNESGWGATSHYKIKIDTKPPNPFEIVVDNTGDPTNPSPNLYFETTDDTSGVDYYRFRVAREDFLNLMLAQINPFPIFFDSFGSYPIVVRAVDKAGNNAEAKTLVEIEPLETPKITLWPRTYVAGEEIFYVEGEAPSNVEVNVLLKKDGRTIKEWQTSSDDEGKWTFSTKDLIKSGAYYLSVMAQDERGAKSLESESREIEISLSGISLGFFLVSQKTIVAFLFLILLLGIFTICCFVYKTQKAKRMLRKETREVGESLDSAFDKLRKEIEKRIEALDQRPGFSEKEREVYEGIKKDLESAQTTIDKEIKDVEKELG